MEDFLVSMAASIILRLLEQPENRGRWQRLFLKLFRAIGAAFASDPEFQGTAKLLSSK